MILILGKGSYPPDSAHGIAHIKAVNYFLDLFWEEFNILGEEDRETLRKAAIIHDIFNGNASPYLGVDDPRYISRERHGLAAAIFAYMWTGDNELADIIDFHTIDNLDETLTNPYLEVLFQSADRLAGLGWVGLTRMFSYLLEEGEYILWPDANEYDHEALESAHREIFYAVILPAVKEKGDQTRAMNFMDRIYTQIGWIFGQSWSQISFERDIFYPQEGFTVSRLLPGVLSLGVPIVMPPINEALEKLLEKKDYL